MLAFALPVLARSDGLPDAVPDITELGHLLHHHQSMGSDQQGLFIAARLLSPSKLAEYSSGSKLALLSALMVADSESVAAGGESRLDFQLGLDTDEAAPLPLRFLIGCAYRHDRQPIAMPRACDWPADRSVAQVERSLGAQLTPPDERLIKRYQRPTVLAPVPLADALQNGLLEMIRRHISACPDEITAGIRQLNRDQVDLHLANDEQVLLVQLPVPALGKARVEHILLQTQALLAQRADAAWHDHGPMH